MSNLEEVTLEDHVALANDMYLGAAGHETSSLIIAYKNRPLTMREGTWIARRVFANPRSTRGPGAVVTASAVVKWIRHRIAS